MTRKRPNLHLHKNSHYQNHQEMKMMMMMMMMEEDDQNKQLIPRLLNDISQLILSMIPPSLLFRVCLSWRHFIYSPLFPPFLSLYSLLTPVTTTTPASINFSSFDPISSRWLPLPPTPHPPLQLLLRHPSFISRNLPIQAVTTAAKLIVVAATSQHLLPALPQPLVFDPLTRGWGYGPILPVPRRWCIAGALGGSVYVASGVGSHFSTDTAKSVHKWDLIKNNNSNNHNNQWTQVKSLKDGRFAREAVDAVGWQGKLCAFNVTAKEGAVYDPRKDEWQEMAVGMVEGWRGPVAAMEEKEIYVVDEGKGVLRKYDEKADCWVDVVEYERLRGAQQMAAGGGKVCVVCGGGEIAVVDVAAKPARVWVVEPPVGFKAVAVHILPRMIM